MMNFSEALDAAWSLAEEAHSNQMYADEPYLNHVKRVYARVCQITDEETRKAEIVAILHDTVEDGNITLERILDVFGFAIRDAVDAITRRKNEKYFDYIQRASQNPLAKIVKACDLIENLQRTYINKDHESKRKRYIQALTWLAIN